MVLERPLPPEHIVRSSALVSQFEPAPEVTEWIRAVIIEESGQLHNPDHEHLAQADIGVLWASMAMRTKGRTVIGTAEIPQPRGSGWVKARQERQLWDWFDCELDFLITLAAPWCAEADNASWCALVEHELYHCAQAEDEFGCPRFNQQTGRPIYRIRGHDVEEHIGVVRRYGARAAGPDVQRLIAAAAKPPEVEEAQIAGSCAVCLKAA